MSRYSATASRFRVGRTSPPRTVLVLFLAVVALVTGARVHGLPARR
ncbi:hypothetical protein ABZ567_23785 [Streptomyces sp. NPDC016459]